MTVELGLTGWGDRPIPQQYLAEAYVGTGIYNESHWQSAELDALIQEASITADIETRGGIYEQIAEIFRDEGPILIPYFIPQTAAISDRVGNFDLHPFAGRTDLRQISVGG
jgi:peptide/nickel transport system substrate-binding protein